MLSPVIWPVFTGLACLTVPSVPPPLRSYAVQTTSFTYLLYLYRLAMCLILYATWLLTD